jgi:hypothetical protein
MTDGSAPSTYESPHLPSTQGRPLLAKTDAFKAIVVLKKRMPFHAYKKGRNLREKQMSCL